MKNAKSKIDPMKGVVKPDVLIENMRKMVAGDANARSYCRGSLNYLSRKPPNPYIVPLLQRAMEK